MADSERYHFGSFTLDAAERRLTKRHETIALPPKTFDLLLALVRRSGHLVTKNDLLQAVWPETFVEEGILTVHIARLRKALDDGPRGQRLIETVSRSGYRFKENVTPAPPHEAVESMPSPPAALEKTIAVLPFVNISSNPGDEYFSDGLTEEIIHALTQVPGLMVIARTSAFAFKSSQQDVRQIAQTLGVATVLEGSVRRFGDRIRVTAQLVKASDATHLWSGRYDHETADVFEVQDQIACAIVSALHLPFSAAPRYAPILPAFEAYLQALYHQRMLTPESLAKSRQYFEQATALDPAFALARSKMGLCFFSLVVADQCPPHTGMPLVREAARAALAIDPTLPEAHSLLGWVATVYDYDWAEAARAFEVAMRHETIPATVRMQYGVYLAAIGRADDAAAELQQALQQDPFDHQARAMLAGTFELLGRTQDAAHQLDVMIELNPTSWLAQFLMGVFRAFRGAYKEARPFATRAYELAPWYSGVAGLFAGVLARTGDRARSRKVLHALSATNVTGTPIGFGVFNLVCGEIDRAADFFATAIEQRHPRTILILCGAPRGLLQQSARWPALAKMMNLPSPPSGSAHGRRTAPETAVRDRWRLP
jgi:TolB-like protein/Tfp pilus assembly protein PilF